MKYSYHQEATRWGEALPLGNGHIGAMFYGGVGNDRIDLTENTYFSGEKSSHNHQTNSAAAFQSMRAAALHEDFDSVINHSKDFIGLRQNYGTNLPVGSLFIRHTSPLCSTFEYDRTLDFQHGVATCSYTITNDLNQSIKCRKYACVSHPDDLFLYEFEFTAPVSLEISYKPSNSQHEALTLADIQENSPQPISYQKEEIGHLSFEGKALESMHSDGKCGTFLAGDLLLLSNGHVTTDSTGSSLHTSDCTHLVLYLCIKTNFQHRTANSALLHKKNQEQLKRVSLRSVLSLWEKHTADVSGFMNRTILSLPDAKDAALLFQYGRYLLLCSSREDSLLPAHLQGVWNDSVACRIGWTCDMHLDINTQMNYWPADLTSIPETLSPLIQWIRNDLIPSGRQTADVNYGYPGWVAELVSNAFGYTAPYWATPISPCPTGGIWILTHVFEHFRFYPDKDFLRMIAYPMIREAFLFFQAYIFEKSDGTLTSGPSISPENAFIKNGHTYHISNGCTYEILMIRELCLLFLESYHILSLDPEKDIHRDSLLAKQAQEILIRLLPYRIAADGTLAEWDHDYPSADSQHRHTSHLLGLYPFSQITPETTPDLANAARSSILARTTPEEGFEDTGWARSLLLLYAARLHDGNMALHHVNDMLTNLLEVNHFIIHPPTRGTETTEGVYELDGNTGFTSGIAEMLLQSHSLLSPDYTDFSSFPTIPVLQILPALPAEWKKGSISGLRARGGITVDITWNLEDASAADSHVTLLADCDTLCRIIFQEREWTIELKKGILMTKKLK